MQILKQVSNKAKIRINAQIHIIQTFIFNKKNEFLWFLSIITLHFCNFALQKDFININI
jgi:hypothetical protein